MTTLLAPLLSAFRRIVSKSSRWPMSATKHATRQP